ncbi:tyrosine-protein phosphatase 99A-like isoform X2 [Mya arenaria]|uniref:tyrosine-protein phosphatase 99A-like isoform X2 n=1 Tax=Mya arenaria TaxID=6604 RepID=UPI0022E1EE4C|nr:tyrosine-protein phosphatase 99A-like isoform X2 [Mya arenaria]
MRWNLLNISHARACLTVVLCIFVTTSECILDFPQTPGVVYSPVNEDVSIPCALSFPADETLELLMWYHDGVWILHTGTDLNVKFSDTVPSGKFRLVDDTYTLQIRSVYKEDTGNYTCKKSYKAQVDGSLKFVEKNVTTELIVQDIHDNSSVADNSSNSSSSSSTLADLTYAVHSSDGAETMPNVTVDDFVDDDTRLLGNTTTVAMATKDSLSPDVPSPPGAVKVNDVQSRECVVSWQESLNDNNSPITHYIINVKEVTEDDWKKSRSLLVNGQTTTIIVRDLIPFTYYQIRVIAKNALGNSDPSMSSSIFNTKGEAPGKPPKNVKATSPVSTKIQLTWELQDKVYNNGIPEGYIVEYKKVNEIEVRAFTIEGAATTSALIENLTPFTNYSVKILMFNDIDNGPAAEVFVMTSEGVPAKPRISHLSDRQSTSFVVNWEAPMEYNGILKNYQLQWIHNNTYKTRIITGHLTQPMRALISNLEPYTSYQLRVRAETGGGYSDYSDLYPALTDVKGASAPKILNVTVLSPTSVVVQWSAPEIVYKKVDSYFIYYRTDGAETPWSNEVMVAENEHTRVLTGLPTNNHFKLKIAAITQSIFSTATYRGDYSEEVAFQLEDPTMMTATKPETSQAGMIAGIIVGFTIMIIIVAVVIGYKSMTCRKYTRSLYYLAVPTNSQSPQTTVVFPPDTVGKKYKYLMKSMTCRKYTRSLYYLAVPTNSQSPQTTVVFPPDTVDSGASQYKDIMVGNFLQHSRNMHANSDVGFSTEFEEIATNTRTNLLAEQSDLPENKHKNRYVNISAYDHSRVTLQQIQGKPKSCDYINANFIDGYNKPKAYIATQGPLPRTFADFWRMVWEHNSIVIVMITNLVERGRLKCDMYWPNEGQETYGTIMVKHLNTISRAHYTVRLFSLKCCKNKKKQVSERIVYQYHYTEWPDHGVPEFTLPVLKFIQKSSSDNPPGAGPIVIHCSAGVGRTGTYILIESMIKQILDRGTINIPAFLLHIRQQRKSLVQTEEQYMLIHDAIAEWILTQGDPEIKESDLTKQLARLTRQVNGEIPPIDIQYNLVTSFSPQPDDMFHALKPVNLCKNRDLKYVPLSVKRVALPMVPGEEGSDYINATYLQGYTKTNEFIITQHPLEHTMEDFWRMVWDQNSSVIVQLSNVDEVEYKSFWHAQGHTIDIGGNFKLTYREDDDRKKFKVKEFLLQSNQDDYILMTRIVTWNDDWPESCSPLHQVFDFVDEVQTLHKHNDMGPVIVVDRFGGVEAATFCALWSIYDQLQYDKSVNVYMLAKLYHLKRAGGIGSKENYQFLYEAAASLSEKWCERDKQSSPGSIRLHLGSKKNGSMPRSTTANSKVETDV